MRRKRTILTALAGLLVVTMGVVGVFVLNPSGIKVVMTAPSSLSPAAGSADCSSNHPRFYYGFATLRAQLGQRMGDPIECEQPIHANGDTRQRTTTGYAYYRKLDNVPTFTNGWEHWALTGDGLVYWTGDVVDPPTVRSTPGN